MKLTHSIEFLGLLLDASSMTIIHCSSKQEGASDSAVSNTNVKSNTDFNLSLGTDVRLDGCSTSSYSSSTPVLQATGEAEDQNSSLTRL